MEFINPYPRVYIYIAVFLIMIVVNLFLFLYINLKYSKKNKKIFIIFNIIAFLNSYSNVNTEIIEIKILRNTPFKGVPEKPFIISIILSIIWLICNLIYFIYKYKKIEGEKNAKKSNCGKLENEQISK